MGGLHPWPWRAPGAFRPPLKTVCVDFCFHNQSSAFSTINFRKKAVIEHIVRNRFDHLNPSSKVPVRLSVRRIVAKNPSIISWVQMKVDEGQIDSE
jgi:hypothetical protein